jgi:hypothetical protein
MQAALGARRHRYLMQIINLTEADSRRIEQVAALLIDGFSDWSARQAPSFRAGKESAEALADLFGG